MKKILNFLFEHKTLRREAAKEVLYWMAETVDGQISSPSLLASAKEQKPETLLNRF